MSTQVTINDVLPKTQAIASAGQTVFDTDWTVNALTDVLVYARADGVPADDTTQLVSPIGYTVTLVGGSETVRVTFSVGRTLDDIITITRDTPADRLNLYTNTNFTPSMLNQDIGILTLVDQQAQLYDQEIAPRYNVSETLQDFDLVLPLLIENQIWAKNPTNDAFIPYDVPASGTLAPGEAEYIIKTATSELPNAQAIGELASGLMTVTTSSGDVGSVVLTGQNLQISVINGDGMAGNPVIHIADNPTVPGTAGMGIPSGTTAQRVTPTPPSIGLRFNTDLNQVEGYILGVWVAIPSATAGLFLPLSGGTMTGDIDMGGNFIHNLIDPVDPQDAATKEYVDTTGANPGGILGNIQYNNGTGFGGDANFNTDGAGNVAIDGTLVIDDITIDGHIITATSLSGGLTLSSEPGSFVDVMEPPPGELFSIIVNGFTVTEGFRVNSIGSSSLVQAVVHKHSTFVEPTMLYARSYSDDDTHVDVPNNIALASLYSAGWTGTQYSLFTQIRMGTDVGTISDTSAPGKLEFLVSQDGSITPMIAMRLRTTRDAEFYGNISVGNLLLSGNTISSTDVNGDITLAPNGTGQVLVPPPTLPLSAATKAYVDAFAQGITMQGACLCASTIALTVTYNNGASGVGATLTNAGVQAAISLDGVSPTVGQRVLIKNQASSLQNGIYTVTVVGSGATNWVLTRADDFDTPAEIQPGDLVVITSGSTLSQSSWIQTATVTAVGTDSISWVQFSASLPITVPNGGSGKTSLTAFAPLFGGTTSTSAMQQTAALTDGQLIIGVTGALPSPATLTAGSGVTIVNAAGTITISTSGGGIATTTIAGTSQSASVNTKYIALNASQTTLTLPSVYSVGDVIILAGATSNTGGWKINASAGDTVRVLNLTTTAGGSVTSTAQAGECIELVCDVANTSWVTTNFTSTLLTTA